MKYTYIFLVLLLTISCGNHDEVAPVEKTEQEAAFNPTPSRMELRGTAAQFNTTWLAYQKFMTELENLDHTATAALRLNTAVDEMQLNVPEQLLTQAFISRLKVLETRVKSYHALLTHNSYKVAVQQKRYDQLILSLDQVKIQMMEVFELEKSQEDLFKTLEELEMELVEKDTITTN